MVWCVLAVARVGRRWVVVACLAVGATHNFQFVAHAVTVCVVDAAVVAVVVGFRIVASPRVGGVRVVVASAGVRAPGNFQFVANAVTICVVDAGTCTVQVRFGREFAAVVVVRGRRVVVAGVGGRASFRFVGVAHAVAVGVVDAVAFAIQQPLRRVGAVATIHDGLRVEVASIDVQASSNLGIVAHAIAVGVDASCCLSHGGTNLERDLAAKFVFVFGDFGNHVACAIGQDHASAEFHAIATCVKKRQGVTSGGHATLVDVIVDAGGVVVFAPHHVP